VQVGFTQWAVVAVVRVGMGRSDTGIVGPQRYKGHALCGVQTGFLHHSSTRAASSRSTTVAREAVPRTGG
jgi:hypothetical protein